jgi:mannonate dehydratase
MIASVEVVVSRPGRNFVTVIITTDDGVVGLGDATLNGRELSVVSYLRDHIAPLLVGRDHHAIEDTWQYLYRGGYWRRGAVSMAAISAIDIALWDIKAKLAGMPLYQLLGGASRTAIRAYGHASGHTTEQLMNSVRERLAQGFTAVRLQTGVPGLATSYGTGAPHSSAAYEPAQSGPRPAEESWNTAAYLRHMPRVFEAVRSEFGDELDLLHDAHNRLTPTEAGRLGRDLEPYRPFWLEDVTPVENPESLRYVRQATTVPLAIGETFTSIHDAHLLMREQLIDYVRCAVSHAGGITAVRRIFDLAALYQVKSAVHGPSDISPIGLSAALHLDLAINNFGIQEFMQYPAETSEVFDVGYSFSGGSFRLGDRPGLGVEFDLDAARALPYQQAYLPINRLTDGTMHDW